MEQIIPGRPSLKNYEIGKSALPDGAATEEKQDNIITELQSISTSTYTSIYDIGDTNIYIGKAVIGSATSGAVWRIYRIAISGDIYTKTFADGNSNYDNIWNNRAILSYS